MKKIPLSFLLFLVITPFFKAIAASSNPYEDSPDSIDPPPPALLMSMCMFYSFLE
jgi:hypothetical protein